jgi:hypothetical protein
MSVLARYGMVVVLAGLLLGGCSGGIEPLSGGGSETPNSMTLAAAGGAVWGSGPGGVALWIKPVTHVPARGESVVPDAVTDDGGNFSIRGLRQGYYHVVGTDSNGIRGFLAESLWVSTELVQDSMTLRLDSLGAVAGFVRSSLREKLRQVYLLGTPFVTFSDDRGGFVLEGVPRGRYVVATDRLVGARPAKVIGQGDNPPQYMPRPLEMVGAASPVVVESAQTVVVELREEIVDTL